jgi:hypothetical protein
VSSYLQLLQQTITWREVTDADLAICEVGLTSPSGNDAIFVRNAVKRLFNRSYAERDDQEIANFAALIDDYMSRDSYCCLFYGREFRKILTYLQRRGEIARARQLLEKHLLSLGVLRADGDSMSFGRFPIGGNYSSSWPMIFFDAYARLLFKQGQTAAAKALLVESLNAGNLFDDAVIMLNRTLEALEGSKAAPKLPTVAVKKTDLDARYLAEPTIEFVALAYLKDELNREGVFADVDVWRLIPAVIRAELSGRTSPRSTWAA